MSVSSFSKLPNYWYDTWKSIRTLFIFMLHTKLFCPPYVQNACLLLLACRGQPKKYFQTPYVLLHCINIWRMEMRCHDVERFGISCVQRVNIVCRNGITDRAINIHSLMDTFKQHRLFILSPASSMFKTLYIYIVI